MKNILIGLLLILCLDVTAQNRIKITNKQSMPKFKEEFEAFIDANGDTIKNGYYRKISGRGNNENQVLMSGFYKNNLQNGLWEISGGKGAYKDGLKVGIWNYFNFVFKSAKYGYLHIPATMPLQQYDYDKNILLLNREDTTKYQECLDFDLKNSIKLDKLPILIGTLGFIQTCIADDIIYPREATKNNIQGKVKYGLKIDEKGNVIDVVLIEGIGYGCDETVINSVKKHMEKLKFVPASKNSKPIAICLVLSYGFKIV